MKIFEIFCNESGEIIKKKEFPISELMELWFATRSYNIENKISDLRYLVTLLLSEENRVDIYKKIIRDIGERDGYDWRGDKFYLTKYIIEE